MLISSTSLVYRDVSGNDVDPITGQETEELEDDEREEGDSRDVKGGGGELEAEELRSRRHRLRRNLFLLSPLPFRSPAFLSPTTDER